MEFRVLGRLEVRASNGEELALGGPKQRTVLAVLTIHANQIVSADRIVDVVWGDDPPPSAPGTLQAYISRLRRILSPETSIVSRAPGYMLRVSPDELDAAIFERLVREGRRSFSDHALGVAEEQLTRALSLWRGEVLSDFPDARFFQHEASRLSDLRLAALEDLLEVRLELGRHIEIVSELEGLLSTHPLRERLWALLMVALYRSGRQADALRAFRRAAQSLGEELGIEPGPILKELEEQILFHDPSLWTPRQSTPTSALPRGTLTFFFSDVEGSTAVWEARPREMGVAIERLERLLSQAVSSEGGHVFKRTGDGILAVFETAPAALRAAIAAQQRLIDEAGEPVLRVRMALHSGEAVPRGDDYVGMALHRTSRVLGAAWGGQVVLTSPTAGLIADQIPEGVQLRDLGEFLLPGLGQPQRILQACHPDLPADFPPLRTLSAHQTNLPVPRTSFVGRELELEDVRKLLTEERLVTLVGPGGTGKTRLAVQLGLEILDEISDGVWWTDLSGLSESTLVLQAVARSLGVLEGPGRPLMERLTAHLRERSVLLILDNCEHLVDGVAALVSDLLSSCPSMRVLATSRQALGVPGEVLYQVPTMAIPDAEPSADLELLRNNASVRLFAERAEEVRPGFWIEEENAWAIARICNHLEGIPLAIELAAARLRVLSPGQIADRVSDRFGLLRSTQAILPRHQTLQAALDWSFELLDPSEQDLLAQVAVFRGGFTLEAAQSVSATTDPLDAIHSLVDKSLVTAEPRDHGEIRFGLLETVREYALAHLRERGGVEACLARHARFYRELVLGAEPHLTGSGQQHWIRRLEAEIDNLRAALDWFHSEGTPQEHLEMASALADFWLITTRLEEGDTRLQEALSHPDLPESATRARAMAALATCLTGHVDQELMEARARASVEIARKTSDRSVLALALRILGWALWWRRSYEEAVQVLEEGIVQALEAGDDRNHGYALQVLARVASELGDHREGIRLASESVGLLDRSGDQHGLAWSLATKGIIQVSAGDYSGAHSSLELAVELFRQLGDAWGLSIALMRLGEVAIQERSHSKARELLEAAMNLARKTGIFVNLGEGLAWLGILAIREGNLGEARSSLREALIMWGGHSSFAAAPVLLGLAKLAVADRQPGRAAWLLGIAAHTSRSVRTLWETPERELAGRLEEAIRQTLTEEQFEEEYRRGMALGINAAYDAALDWLSLDPVL